MTRIRIEEEEALLPSLTPDQSRTIQESIGEYWRYEVRSAARKSFLSQLDVEESEADDASAPSLESDSSSEGVITYQGSDHVYITPDPARASNILTALQDPQIREGVGLGQAEADAVAQLTQYRRGTLNIIAFDSQLERALANTLSTTQLERTKQLMIRKGIAFTGWEQALTRGWLAAQADINVQQRSQIRRKAKQLSARARIRSTEAHRKAESAVLAVLPDEQRGIATQVLGPFLLWPIATEEERLLREVIQRVDSAQTELP